MIGKGDNAVSSGNVRTKDIIGIINCRIVQAAPNISGLKFQPYLSDKIAEKVIIKAWIRATPENNRTRKKVS
jgi:hypothetical protein